MRILLVLVAAFVGACATTPQREVIVVSEDEPCISEECAVPSPPPEPYAELPPPAPDPYWVWIPGAWHHGDGGWIWNGGYWCPPRVGYVYVVPTYGVRGRRHTYRRGHWRRDRERERRHRGYAVSSEPARPPATPARPVPKSRPIWSPRPAQPAMQTPPRAHETSRIGVPPVRMPEPTRRRPKRVRPNEHRRAVVVTPTPPTVPRRHSDRRRRHTTPQKRVRAPKRSHMARPKVTTVESEESQKKKKKSYDAPIRRKGPRERLRRGAPRLR